MSDARDLLEHHCCYCRTYDFVGVFDLYLSCIRDLAELDRKEEQNIPYQITHRYNV